MSPTVLPLLLPVTALVAAMCSGLVGLWRATAARVVALVGVAAVLALALAGIAAVGGGDSIHHEIGGWPPPIGIEYVLDPLSAFMAVVVSGIGLFAVVFPARAGFALVPGRAVPMYALVLLLLAGLLGVAVSGDLFHLFVFLEIYAIASYALVALGGDRAVYASFRYLLIGTVGSGLYLLGVGFIYFSTGSLNMADVAGLLPALGDSPTVAGAAVLITVGLGIKMALFPLHVWLPDAHATAPPAVAALLAAVQVKIGAYALVRILYGVFGPAYVTEQVPIASALVWFGAAGILVGSVMAIAQRDVKRMLAYSTVAQLGIIGVGIGLASPLALTAALFHVLNHAVMKSCLFFVAGGIYAQTGIKEIPRFAGLGRRMPLTMAAFTVAALSMVGIPPTAGFFSKLYLVLGSVEAGAWVPAVVIVGSSLLTAAYFLRVLENIYARTTTEAVVDRAREPGAVVVGTVAVLGVTLLVTGVANVALVEGFLEPLAVSLLGP